MAVEDVQVEIKLIKGVFAFTQTKKDLRMHDIDVRSQKKKGNDFFMPLSGDFVFLSKLRIFLQCLKIKMLARNTCCIQL